MHSETVTIPARTMPAGWLIGPRSYLLDRFDPQCARISLPPRTMPGGELSFGLVDTSDPDPLSSRLGLRRESQASSDRLIYDARRLGSQNWAHFLDDVLPVLFFVCDRLSIALDELELVMPRDTPGFILRMAEALGIATRLSDLRPRGRMIAVTVEPYLGVRAIRAEWAALPSARAVMDPIIARGADDLPTRVFLSRRKTRALENEAEVSSHLAKRGYRTVYPEDLTVPDQLRLFRDAEEIVAIHGAGLAPMIYAQPGGRLRQLIEILPCGHMTDNFRGMAHLTGLSWIGVQGQIKPKYVTPAYDLGTSYRIHSLDNFSVDPASLNLAFEMLDETAVGRLPER